MVVHQDLALGTDGVVMPRVCVSVKIPDVSADLVYNFLRDKARSVGWHRDITSAVEITERLGAEALPAPDEGAGPPGSGLASLRLWLTRYRVPAAVKYLGFPAPEVVERRVCSAADKEAYLIVGTSTNTESMNVPVTPGHRRAHLTLSAYAVVSLPEGGCEVRTVTHLNPGSAPAWLVDKVTVNKPVEFCSDLIAGLKAAGAGA